MKSVIHVYNHTQFMYGRLDFFQKKSLSVYKRETQVENVSITVLSIGLVCVSGDQEAGSHPRV